MKKGGGPDDDVPASPPHVEAPFYADLFPSALVADWLLDYVTMTLSAIHHRDEIKVIGADLVRHWLERGAGAEMRPWTRGGQTR